ncbi:MAG: tetratricopeptide repeat protein [Saprospiraceae bacterium]|nr:tetratricopeptide repeat protein [Saprospiraceae bacterium]
MKIKYKMRKLILLSIVLTIASCGQIMTEVEALKKNEQGLSELNSGQFDQAIISFKEAIKSPKLSTETRAQIFRNIAQTFSEKKQQDSSIYYSRLAANCYDKNSYEYLVNIADINLLTGKTKDALDNLNIAYEKNPNRLEVNNSLGLIYLGDYGTEFMDVKKALKFNQKAFEINKDRITEDVLGRNYFELEDYNNAEKHYEKLLTEYPDILPYSLNLGMIKFKLNKQKEADKLFDQVINADSSMIYMIKAFKDENE